MKQIEIIKKTFWKMIYESDRFTGLDKDKVEDKDFIKRHVSIETSFDRNFTGNEIDCCIKGVETAVTTYSSLRFDGMFFCIITKNFSQSDILMLQAHLLLIEV